MTDLQHHNRLLKCGGFLFLIFTTTFLHLIYSYGYMSEYEPVLSHMVNQAQVPLQEKASEAMSSVKTIYIWDRPSWFLRSVFASKDFFVEYGCEVDKCRLVDRAVLPEGNYSQADAVLFNILFLESTPLPYFHRQDQIWIFFGVEAPLHGYPTDMKDKFNMTLTYMRHPDTDIYSPYGLIIPQSHDYHIPTEETIRNKTNMAAWVVSNCNAPSQRMNYVKELGKYIKVDIYGRCGNSSCDRRGNACLNYIEQTYKFYLAFENMYCEQYATEKVFRILKYDIIPVVLGGANYSNLIPKYSYIDVRDFTSPRHLAAYLSQLAGNPAEYAGYFQWKKQYSVDTRNWNHLCELCKILNNASYPFKHNFDANEYWDSAKNCKHGTEEASILHLQGL